MENKKTLPIIYVIGMPIILIIANFMANLHITTLGGSAIYFSVLLYPLTILISGLIVRKTDYKNALRMMSVALITASLAGVIEWALLSSMRPWVLIYSFLSFLLCQLIFIFTYDFLIKIKKDTFMRVFLLIAVVSIIDHAFFGAIIEGKYISLSILIRAIYMAVFPAILARNTGKK